MTKLEITLAVALGILLFGIFLFTSHCLEGIK